MIQYRLKLMQSDGAGRVTAALEEAKRQVAGLLSRLGLFTTLDGYAHNNERNQQPQPPWLAFLAVVIIRVFFLWRPTRVNVLAQLVVVGVKKFLVSSNRRPR